MLKYVQGRFPRRAAIAILAVLSVVLTPAYRAAAQDKTTAKLADPIATGQRVYTCGHSFHVWVPAIMTDPRGQSAHRGAQTARHLIDRRLPNHSALGR